MIIMRLQVTKLRPPRIDPENCDGDREVDYNGMPVAEFKGTSHSLHSAWDPNANSGIRGIRGSYPSQPNGHCHLEAFANVRVDRYRKIHARRRDPLDDHLRV